MSRRAGWRPPLRLVGAVSVLVLDISDGGCLLESHQPLAPGRTGTLRVALNGGWRTEDLRVTRCVALPGRGSTYRVGAEFLRTRRHPDQSLWHAVGRLIDGSSRHARVTRAEHPLEEKQ